MTLRQLLGDCFSLFCAAMLGLAAGALWLIPVVYLRHPLPWFALPLAIVLAQTVRPWARGRRPMMALLAALSVLIACAYVRVLLAGVMLSSLTDYPLLTAIHAAGWPMLRDMAWLGVGRNDWNWSVAALVLAALLAARRTH